MEPEYKGYVGGHIGDTCLEEAIYVYTPKYTIVASIFFSIIPI